MNALRYCYQRSLVRNPTLAGSASFRFGIDMSGSVVQAIPSNVTIADANVPQCIVMRLQRMRFPKSSDGKPVEVGFSLRFLP